MPILARTAVVRTVLAPQALVAGPRLDERAVDAEVLTRQQAALVGHLDDGVEQLRDHIVLDEAVAVLAEYRVVPHAGLGAESALLEHCCTVPARADLVQPGPEHCGNQKVLERRHSGIQSGIW
jgi:hypothetical protein